MSPLSIASLISSSVNEMSSKNRDRVIPTEAKEGGKGNIAFKKRLDFFSSAVGRICLLMYQGEKPTHVFSNNP